MTLSRIVHHPALVLCALALAACNGTAPAAEAQPQSALPAMASPQATPISQTPDVVEVHPGYAPAGAGRTVSAALYAELQPGARLGLTTTGSRHCPPTPVRIRYENRSTITVELAGAAACVFLDFAYTTFVVQLDASRIDPAGPLSVRIEGSDRGYGSGTSPVVRHIKTLSAELVDRRVRVLETRRGAPDGRRLEPSAQLTDGGLAVTTYGSSSCPLMPVEMEVRKRSTVEVWLDTRPEAGIECTQDTAPTTFVVALDPEALDFCRSVQARITLGHMTLSTHVLHDPEVTTQTRETCPAPSAAGR